MKVLKQTILWSFIIGAISVLLVFTTKAMLFAYLFYICGPVFLIALLVLFFGGERIENSEAKKNYEAFVNNNVRSEYDRKDEISYSGKWHVIPNNDRSKLLFIKTDAKDCQEFEIEDFYISNSVSDGNGLVAIDSKRKKLLLYNFDDKNPAYIVIAYADLLSVAVVTDGVMISEKSTMRTVGGALVGGALMGGAGAVVGGLSGSATQGQKIGKVSVKFVLRDISTPSFEIAFLDMMKIKPSDPEYHKVERALKKANEVKDLTSIVIDEVDRTEKVKSNNVKLVGSIADELEKLAELKAKGILTEEEFNAQKAKLLL